MVEVKGLSKKYADNTAIKNLNFNVNKGEIVGFVGQNGAGKTTTMNIIAGFTFPTEGSVLINGFDMLEEPKKAKKCIGYLPENPPLYLDMSIDEYLNFVCDIKGIKKNNKKEMILNLKDMLELKDMSKRLIKNLSKGYKQRVGLAGAMVGFPEVLILDEPTVGLDPAQVIELRKTIKKLGQKSTVILSSHILSELSSMCNRVIIINKGEIVINQNTKDPKSNKGHGYNILVKVIGKEEQIKKAFKNNKKVKIKSIVKTKEEGKYDIVLFNNEKKDIREITSKILSNNKLTILMMKPMEETLEETFLNIVLGEGEKNDCRI